MASILRQTPGARFQSALKAHKPLQIVGAINAFSARIAEHAGAHALYLSGSGVAVASHGLPDLGITNLCDVAEDVRRITSTTRLPLLVDIDTGFGSAFGITRTIHSLMKSGAAAVHMEDQVADKRCGHRPGKQLVSTDEMVDRVKTAVHAKKLNADIDPQFTIMARTDAIAVEGLENALKRAQAYLDAGADMIFAEACLSMDMLLEFKKLKDSSGQPAKILCNITEFGMTPLFTFEELKLAGIDMALYPLSAHRAMCRAALKVYTAILEKGTQKSVLEDMQTRKELYDIIGYQKFEKTLDDLFENDVEKKDGIC